MQTCCGSIDANDCHRMLDLSSVMSNKIGCKSTLSKHDTSFKAITAKRKVTELM